MEEKKYGDLMIPRSRGSFQGQKLFTWALEDEVWAGREPGHVQEWGLPNLAGAQGMGQTQVVGDKDM